MLCNVNLRKVTMRVAMKLAWFLLGLLVATVPGSLVCADAVEPRSVSPVAAATCPQDPGQLEDFRLTIEVPPHCRSQSNRSDCSLFVGLSTSRQDPSFLDVVLEGAAEGWVAVGFSETKDMFGSNVLGCTRYGNDSVHAVDTWNPHKGRTNELNTNQDGICQYSASFEDGRLACRFSRLIEGVNAEQDLNLNGEYYTLFGDGPTPAKTETDGLSYHRQPAPSVSERKMNPVTGKGSLVQSRTAIILTKTHGILMVVAWPVLAVTGAYFSAFMKPALPNGAWFQVHRTLMVVSLFLGASAFVLIFASNWDSNPRGLIDLSTRLPLSHFIIGITVMTLHLANPMIALFRCKPDGRFRWIFNILHGKVIGYLAMILAVTNITLGITLLTGTVSAAPFGLHISIVGYGVLLFLTAHFVFNLLPAFWKKGNEDQEEHPLVGQRPAGSSSSRDLGRKEGGAPSEHSAKLRPSADSKLRWAGLVVLLLLLLPVAFAVCVLIALS